MADVIRCGFKACGCQVAHTDRATVCPGCRHGAAWHLAAGAYPYDPSRVRGSSVFGKGTNAIQVQDKPAEEGLTVTTVVQAPTAQDKERENFARAREIEAKKEEERLREKARLAALEKAKIENEIRERETKQKELERQAKEREINESREKAAREREAREAREKEMAEQLARDREAKEAKLALEAKARREREAALVAEREKERAERERLRKEQELIQQQEREKAQLAAREQLEKEQEILNKSKQTTVGRTPEKTSQDAMTKGELEAAQTPVKVIVRSNSAKKENKRDIQAQNTDELVTTISYSDNTLTKKMAQQLKNKRLVVEEDEAEIVPLEEEHSTQTLTTQAGHSTPNARPSSIAKPRRTPRSALQQTPSRRAGGSSALEVQPVAPSFEVTVTPEPQSTSSCPSNPTATKPSRLPFPSPRTMLTATRKSPRHELNPSPKKPVSTTSFPETSTQSRSPKKQTPQTSVSTVHKPAHSPRPRAPLKEVVPSSSGIAAMKARYLAAAAGEQKPATSTLPKHGTLGSNWMSNVRATFETKQETLTKRKFEGDKTAPAEQPRNLKKENVIPSPTKPPPSISSAKPLLPSLLAPPSSFLAPPSSFLAQSSIESSTTSVTVCEVKVEGTARMTKRKEEALVSPRGKMVALSQKSSPSPQKASASPQKTSASPQKTSTSPQKTSTSPQKTSASPQKTSVSPQKLPPSPQKLLLPSPQKLPPSSRKPASPQKPPPSPRKFAASPQKPCASPRILSSPQKPLSNPLPVQSTPQKSCLSPQKLYQSPQKSQSTFQKTTESAQKLSPMRCARSPAKTPDSTMRGRSRVATGITWGGVCYGSCPTKATVLDTGEEKLGKDALLEWCIRVNKGFVEIKNFRNPSWCSGLGFAGIAAAYRPDLIDFDALKSRTPSEVNTAAFNAAKLMGISVLLDVEDMPHVDDKCIITQISQYIQHLWGRVPTNLRG